MGCCRRFGGRVQCFLQAHMLMIIWTSLVQFVFWMSYFHYKREPQYYYLRSILGVGLFTSRGSASVLNVSCCLVLLPMLKGVLLHIRRLHSFSPFLLTCVVDKCKAIHKSLAITIILMSVVHTASHAVNAYNFSMQYKSAFGDLNLAKFQGENPVLILLNTVPGITGLIMLALLSIMFATSWRCCRRNHFDLFSYSHYLYLPFLLLLICHPLSGILKEQTNLEAHTPGCLEANDEGTNNLACKERPLFHSMASKTWLWVGIPLIIYLMDSLSTWVTLTPTQILYARLHPSHVLELGFYQQSFRCQPGQYILLRCPDVSKLQWHAFSITSSVSGYFSLHIKTLGDWTRELKKYVDDRALKSINHEGKSGKGVVWYNTYLTMPKPQVDIRGPFSSPMQDIISFPFSLCIAGGVGITPFSAVINGMLVESEKKKPPIKLSIIWVCRNPDEFSWMLDTLYAIYDKYWNLNLPEYFSVQLYFTQKCSSEELQVALEPYHAFFTPRVFFGRPAWDSQFDLMKDMHYRETVGVFCCGPTTMCREVKDYCDTYNLKGAKFVYKQERFS